DSYGSQKTTAEPHFREAIRLRQELVNDERKLPVLGECLIDQANNYRDRGRVADAVPVYSEALAVFEELLTKAPQNPTYIRDAAIAYANLGHLDVPSDWKSLSASEKTTKAERARNCFK